MLGTWVYVVAMLAVDTMSNNRTFEGNLRISCRVREPFWVRGTVKIAVRSDQKKKRSVKKPTLG